MQVTIDSSDPLERALRVLGSLYGVELAVAESDAPIPDVVAKSPRRARRRPTKKAVSGTPDRRRSRRGAPRSSTADLTAVRSWARDNGFQVSDRGRVSNAVLDAYREAVSAR